MADFDLSGIHRMEAVRKYTPVAMIFNNKKNQSDH